jgi:hypothetical protein
MLGQAIGSAYKYTNPQNSTEDNKLFEEACDGKLGPLACRTCPELLRGTIGPTWEQNNILAFYSPAQPLVSPKGPVCGNSEKTLRRQKNIQLARRIYQLPGISGRTTIAAQAPPQQEFAERRLL